MTVSAPKTDPATSAPSLVPATVEPHCSLLVMCTECGQGSEVPLPFDRDALVRFLAKIGWYLAVLTSPGEVPIVLTAICTSCASTVFPPEVMKAAEERRQQVLQQVPSVNCSGEFQR